MEIPIEADELENMYKQVLVQELKTQDIRCKSNTKRRPIKYWLKEALANKVFVVGKEASPANTKKNNPKFNSMIGQCFIRNEY